MHKITLDKTLPKNLPLLLKQRVSEIGDFFLQAAKNKEGKFVYYTYKQVYSEIIAFAKALKSIGIKRNDNVALISDNRREWFIADMALLSIGSRDVPRGCDSMGNEIRFIISFAECKAGIFENYKQVLKVLEKSEETPLLKTAILFDPVPEDQKEKIYNKGIEILTFEELLQKGKELVQNESDSQKQIEAEMEITEPDDLATIIFTSGTTGKPKGVMLTHNNYITQLSAVHNFTPCKPGDWWMTILPVWHSFERLIQYVVPLMKCGIAYSKPVAPILLPDLAEIRPQWMCGVPRLWESLCKGVNRAMNKKGGASLKLYNFFIKAGKAYIHQKDKVHGDITRFKNRSRFLDCVTGIIPFFLLWPVHLLGDLLVFKKIRAKFGGRISIAISGGGALPKEIDDFYRAIGLNLLEGYGMTETAPVISFRNFRHPRAGCVGQIYPTMQIKIVKEEHGKAISDDPLKPGEKGLIYVKGPQVMKGYYNRPDLTEQIIDKDGWLNTGDLGLLTLDKEIKITGRAKDTIVLLDGENIEPCVLESALLQSNFIESCVVLGQDQKYLACLIVPAKEAIIEWANNNKIKFDEFKNLLNMQEIINLFTKEINSHINIEQGFRVCEKIFKFALLPNSFAVGTELSAKQEIMRFKINEKYSSIIKTLFDK